MDAAPRRFSGSPQRFSNRLAQMRLKSAAAKPAVDVLADIEDKASVAPVPVTQVAMAPAAAPAHPEALPEAPATVPATVPAAAGAPRVRFAGAKKPVAASAASPAQAVRTPLFADTEVSSDDSTSTPPDAPATAESGTGERLSNRLRDLAHDGKKSALGSNPVAAAERSVIGAILTDNKLLEHVHGILIPESFSSPDCQAVFAAIELILDSQVNGVTVAEPVTVALRPGISRHVTMTRLQDWALESACDLETFKGRVHVVRHAYEERNLGAAVIQAQEIAGGDTPVEDRVAAITTIFEKAPQSKAMDAQEIGTFASLAVSELIERSKTGRKLGLYTGFRELDALLGGLQGGQLIVLGARPGMGKTGLALCISNNIAQSGHPVVFTSLEMKGVELAKRQLSVRSGVDSGKIRLAALNEEEWGLVLDAAEQVQTLPLYLTDMASVNLQSLRSVARRMHREGKCALLVVDYLQIMAGNPKLPREQQISEISRGLKMIAMELNIPVMALSQLNRDIEKRANKRPMLSDLRESGALEQDADVVAFIHREELLNQDSSEKGMADIIVAKQRNGAVGELRARFDAPTTAFHDMAVATSAITLAPAIDPLRQAAEELAAQASRRRTSGAR